MYIHMYIDVCMYACVFWSLYFYELALEFSFTCPDWQTSKTDNFNRFERQSARLQKPRKDDLEKEAKDIDAKDGTTRTTGTRRAKENEQDIKERATEEKGSESDELLTRTPPPALEKPEDFDNKKQEADRQLVPRRFAITRRDLVNCGYTPSCPGCYAAANDREHKPHTSKGRDRIAKAMADDETQAHRIRDAQDREDAFLEKWLQPYEKLVEQPIYYKDGPVPRGMFRCTLAQALARGFAVGSIQRAKKILKQRATRRTDRDLRPRTWMHNNPVTEKHA